MKSSFQHVQTHQKRRAAFKGNLLCSLQISAPLYIYLKVRINEKEFEQQNFPDIIHLGFFLVDDEGVCIEAHWNCL